jgi:hypothetical protein
MLWVKYTRDGVTSGGTFASNVLESSTHVTIKGRCILIPEWQERDKTLRLTTLPLPDQSLPIETTQLLAVRHPYREWWPLSEPKRKTPEGVPQSVRVKGPRAVAEYVLNTTSLGRILGIPEVRRVIEEDIFLDDDRLYVPNFIENEEKWQAIWSKERPAAFAKAQELTAIEANCPVNGLTETAVAYRRLVRMAAYRKLDLIRFGRESFRPTPWLGLDPSIKRYTRTKRAVSIGRVSSFEFEKNASVTDFPREYDSLELVEDVEKCIHPGIPSRSLMQLEYWNAAPNWAELRDSFCRFDEQHLPAAIPARNALVEGYMVPHGYVPTFTKKFFEQHRLAPLDLARLHLSVYRSEPALVYLRKVAADPMDRSIVEYAEILLNRILA